LNKNLKKKRELEVNEEQYGLFKYKYHTTYAIHLKMSGEVDKAWKPPPIQKGILWLEEKEDIFKWTFARWKNDKSCINLYFKVVDDSNKKLLNYKPILLHKKSCQSVLNKMYIYTVIHINKKNI
jgi:hypothetical protein